MGEALGHLLAILGNPLAYTIGKYVISILSFGKLSIEPLPKNYPAHFVQAFDDNKVVRTEDHANYSMSHEKALVVGYIVILSAFSTLLYVFRDFFLASKIPE
ncbi:hypothetical protein [Photobacterium satsumensis]|uniref:hypothetical protein n=1 Tax=Photobacterium satsumensis TaxID=2910239 RepID=UPI003D0FC790